MDLPVITLNLSIQGGVRTLSNLIGDNHYKLNDPLGDSIYDALLRLNNSEENITHKLSSKLSWSTDENGYVKIAYDGYFSHKIIKYYRPEDIDTVFKFLGAIYTFYSQLLTYDLLPEILPEEFRVRRVALNLTIYEHLLRGYRVNSLFLDKILFFNGSNVYEIIIK